MVSELISPNVIIDVNVVFEEVLALRGLWCILRSKRVTVDKNVATNKIQM